MDLAMPGLSGVEAVRRSRAQFPSIPVAEKSGKIVDIDRWVLREAIQMLAEAAKDAKPAKKPRKVASGQKEMLMPISGKKPAKEAAAKKPAAKSQRKSA